MMDDGITEVIAQQPHPHLFLTISGAHYYGFPSNDSDYDVRGVHVLPLRDVIGLQETKETIETSAVVRGLEIDLVTHDAAKFFRLLLTRNGYVLEQVFSPLVIHGAEALVTLRALAKGCITRHHVHHYLGFFRTQWRLLERRSAGGEARVKPLLYLYRVVLTGIHLMRTGEVEANLPKLNDIFRLPYIPELIERKVSGLEQGTIAVTDLEFHQAELLRLVVVLEAAGEASTLPATPTSRAALNDYLVQLRLQTPTKSF